MGEPLLLLHGDQQRVEAVQVVPVGGRQLAQRVVQLLGAGQALVPRLRDVLPTLDRGDSLHEQRMRKHSTLARLSQWYSHSRQNHLARGNLVLRWARGNRNLPGIRGIVLLGVGDLGLSAKCTEQKV